MLSKLILVLLILATPILVTAKQADELEARAGSTVIRISSATCTYKDVLSRLKPEHHARFKKAELHTDNKVYKACWTMDTNGVFVMLEDGEQGYIPPEVFKPVETL